MSDASIVALIALIGTLITALIGYRQWKHQQYSTSRRVYQSESRTVYERLWELLPDLSCTLQNDQGLMYLLPDEGELKESLYEVKRFLLKNELYIDNEGKQLVIEYIESLLDARKELTELASELESVFIQFWACMVRESLEKAEPNPISQEEVRRQLEKMNAVYSRPPRELSRASSYHIRRPPTRNPPNLFDDDEYSLRDPKGKSIEAKPAEPVLSPQPSYSPSSSDYSPEGATQGLSNITSSANIPSRVNDYAASRTEPAPTRLKSTISRWNEKMQLKWGEFVFAYPNPFLLKLTEILVPDFKQACRTCRAIAAAMAARGKLVAKIRQVMSK